MSYHTKVILDSVSPKGFRLTTMEVRFPRIVLAEFNTHRMLSRNSASSRAIPVARTLATVLGDPFIPIYWGKNQKGMQANEELTEYAQDQAQRAWLRARDAAVQAARELMDLGVHKQIANRVLEPFMWHTVIVSATTYKNFFALRCHPDAQPEIQRAAYMMREAMDKSAPSLVDYGEWHLPYIDDEDRKNFALPELKKISTGRCARVSTLTHDGNRDPQKDISLGTDLATKGHWSPFEHPATPLEGQFGNFLGWFQYRKEFPTESGL